MILFSFLLLLFCLRLCFCSPSIIPHCNAAGNKTTTYAIVQQNILIDFYNSNQGDSWVQNDGWGNCSLDACSWFGAMCAGGNVTTLILRGQDLTTVYFPRSFENFLTCANVAFDNNRLSSLFVESTSLPYVTLLSLTQNSLRTIPREIFKMSNLKSLLLNSNDS